MDYSNYLKTLYDYEKNQVGTEEKSMLLKVINNVDFSAQIGSYLKFRDKNQLGDTSIVSRLLGLKLLSEKKGLILRGMRKYQLTSTRTFLCVNRNHELSSQSFKKV